VDDLLVQRQPRYAGVRADYERVLKQRNALLRTAYLSRKVGGTGGRTGDLSTLDVWDVHLAKHGAELIAARLDLCAALGTHVAKAHDAVSAGHGEARLAYDGKSWIESTPRDLDRAAIEDHLLNALGAARSSEVERGVTLVGPHRDDLTLALGELPAKGYASHGESWSYALALKLGAYELLRGEGIEPVLVLDDVFAELDGGRRQRLAEMVVGASQVVVTCAVEQDVPRSLTGARYTVGDGQVIRAD
jgi:DNA replication and repair protein RecF